VRLLAVVAFGAILCACGGGTPRDAVPRPRVVRIAIAGDGLLPEVATGVVVRNRRVLTVAHALAGGHTVTAAGRRASVVGIDRRLDLAVLAVPGLRAPAVRLGGDGPNARLAVMRDRRAASLPATVRRRVLVHWRDQPGDRPSDRPGLELAARVDPGDSGAPVVDARGRLLGVLYARSSGDAGTAWAVDASAARTLLER
jgi:S1-C subfamily serine protease